MPSSLKLVGDRYQLVTRQRAAVERAACGDATAARRRARRVGRTQLAGARVVVDGFNTIIVAESLLGGAAVFRGRDRALRDLAGVRGTWRRVEATAMALEVLAQVLAAAREVVWVLDAPVSNSGRLAGYLRDTAAAHGLDWRVELAPDADPVVIALAQASPREEGTVAASADAQIIDAVEAWTDLPSLLVELERSDHGRVEGDNPWIVDLSGPAGACP